jgi:hypothetical protein
MTTTGDVIHLCDGNDNGYRPHSLPPGYSWYKGDSPPMDGNKFCPPGWTSATSYWVLYPEDLVAEGKPNKPWVACNLFIKDTELWLHRKDSDVWDKHQDPNNPITCARMDAPQTGNAGYSIPAPRQPDGSYKMEAPPLGYCNHGWPQHRASFNPDVYDHAFTIMRFKLDNPQANFVAMAGVDWWKSPGAPFPNNQGTGVCAWTKITSDGWTEIYCTQMLVSKFEATPPPGVTKGPAGGGTTPPVEPPIEPPVSTEGGIEISVDGHVLGKGSMVTFKVK